MTQMMTIPQLGGANELATAAAAAQAMAAVQARYALAVARPRNLDQVRVTLLDDCRRPAFADVARYSKPIGGAAVEGPSIRFVEAALRAFGNVFREVSVLYDADEMRLVRVAITDLEANVTHQTELSIRKTVERSRVRDGQTILGERTNSYGRKVYVLAATEDEMAVKQGAQVSKAIRELGLRILPGDLVDEAQAQCARTKMSDASADPEAARKRIADAFVALGVQPSDLEKYLGHPLRQAAPKQVAELRQVHASIRDGEATWAELLAIKRGDSDDEASGDDAAQVKAEPKTKRLAAKIEANNEA